MTLAAAAILVHLAAGLAGHLARRWGGSSHGFQIAAAISWFGLAAPFIRIPGDRYLAFGSVFAATIMLAGLLFRILNRSERPEAGRLAVLFLLIAVPCAVQHVHSPPFDDESMRLTAVLSLLDDGDFDLSNQYRQERWREFRSSAPSYFVDFAGRVKNRLRDEVFVPYHAAGFPVMLAPFYAIGRFFGPTWARLFATIPILLASAATTGLLVRVLAHEGMSTRKARYVSAAYSLSAPVLFFSLHLWPEPLAALAGLWSFSVVMQKRPGVPASAALGFVLAGLPLLHFRYGLLSAPLLLVAVWKFRSSLRIVSLITGAALPALAVVANMAVRSDPGTWKVLIDIGYEFPQNLGLRDFDLGRLIDSRLLWERIVIPPAGLVAYLPWLLLFSLKGLRNRAAALLPSAVMIFGILTYALSSGPLARFWVPIIPLLVLAAIPREGPGRFGCVLMSMAAIKGLALVAVPALCHDALIAGEIAERIPSDFAAFLFLMLAG